MLLHLGFAVLIRHRSRLPGFLIVPMGRSRDDNVKLPVTVCTRDENQTTVVYFRLVVDVSELVVAPLHAIGCRSMLVPAVGSRARAACSHHLEREGKKSIANLRSTSNACCHIPVPMNYHCIPMSVSGHTERKP